MISGIYKIKNIVNGKTYIGSSTDVKKRWRDHKWYLKNNLHHNSHLQNAVNKYGLDNFEFSILLECSKENLINEEIDQIKKHKSDNKISGYNVNKPNKLTYNNGKKHGKTPKKMFGKDNPMYGKFGEKHPKFGFKMSDEMKLVMSKKMSGKKGSKSNARKLNDDDVLIIREYYEKGIYNQTELGKMFNVSQVTIGDVVNYKRWI